jgi:hypothetical protein
VLCIWCREFNDDRAEACRNCGAPLPENPRARVATAEVSPGTSAAPADTSGPRPESAVRDAAEALLTPRDAAGDTLEQPDEEQRDEEALATPEERELVRRIRSERARSRGHRRSLAMVVAAFALLVVAVIATNRGARHPSPAIRAPADVATVASAPADSTASRQPEAPAPRRAEAPAPPEPEARPPREAEARPPRQAQTSVSREPEARAPREAEARPPRQAETSVPREPEARAPRDVAARPARQADAPAPREPEARAPREAEARAPRESTVELPARSPRPEPALPDRLAATESRPAPPRQQRLEPPPLPSAFVRRTILDVHADVTRTPNAQIDGAVDYRVRLWKASGEPVSDADVRLRGLMTDGLLVEARLDRAEAPGTYQGLITFSSRGPRYLTIRVSRGDGLLEIPVGDAPRATAPTGR